MTLLLALAVLLPFSGIAPIGATAGAATRRWLPPGLRRVPAWWSVAAPLAGAACWLAVLLDGAAASLALLRPDLLGAATGAGACAVAAAVTARSGLAADRAAVALLAAGVLSGLAAVPDRPVARLLAVALPVAAVTLAPAGGARARGRRPWRIAGLAGATSLAFSVLPAAPAVPAVWAGALGGAVALAAAQPALAALAPLVVPAVALGVARLTGAGEPAPGLGAVLVVLAALLAAGGAVAGRAAPGALRRPGRTGGGLPLPLHPAVAVAVLALGALAAVDVVPAVATPSPPAGPAPAAGLLLAAGAVLGGAAGRAWAIAAALPGSAALGLALLAADPTPETVIIAVAGAVTVTALAGTPLVRDHRSRPGPARTGPWAARLGVLHLVAFPAEWRWTGASGLRPWQEGAGIALATGLAATVAMLAWRSTRPARATGATGAASAGSLGVSRLPADPAPTRAR